MRTKPIVSFSLLLIPLVVFLSGCQSMRELRMGGDGACATKTAASYEDAGKWWGLRHLKSKPKIQAGTVDPEMVPALVNKDCLDYFWIHNELKDAFKKGYRLGYQDRTADLVLGPHLTAAAARFGYDTSTRFVDVIEIFERDWAATLSAAVDVFITLISEGSPADREKFITSFVNIYDEKYRKTQEALRRVGTFTRMSEGMTTLYIDRKTIAVLNIPSTVSLKTEIYHQTFTVMGDEWARRYSNNLVKRYELVDLLRRSKVALGEVKPGFQGNVDVVRRSFVKAYGTDAENVFRSLIRDAGYSEAPTVTPPGT